MQNPLEVNNVRQREHSVGSEKDTGQMTTDAMV